MQELDRITFINKNTTSIESDRDMTGLHARAQSDYFY